MSHCVPLLMTYLIIYIYNYMYVYCTHIMLMAYPFNFVILYFIDQIQLMTYIHIYIYTVHSLYELLTVYPSNSHSYLANGKLSGLQRKLGEEMPLMCLDVEGI